MTGDAAAIADGAVCLGIELGSTQVKACLVDAAQPARVVASGTHTWQNRLVDARWTYALEDVWTAVQTAYRAMSENALARHGVRPTALRALGVSAMMHGYLAFDAGGELLVPFRTWRNTSTGDAAAALSELFGVNIPLRWSIAHLQQAILDREPHVPRIAHLTTLAGYVHERLTGRRVLGIGDAAGMFPIDPVTGDYDASMADAFDRLETSAVLGCPVRGILPPIGRAGADAGTLTAAGSLLLDPTEALTAGALVCPPEGDAGTGMVATGALSPRTGNVSVGTSIFASVVLDEPPAHAHREIDIVATPEGRAVAMVHCNNGASELGVWVDLFRRFAALTGAPVEVDEAYRVLFDEALTADADAGGVIAYNHLSGEPLVGLDSGRPLVVRTADSDPSLANMMRAQLYGVFATLAIGMQILAGEGVALDRIYAHGGVFRTAGVAQRMLAAALDTPVLTARTASDGGAWGAAVLAAFRVVRAASDGNGTAAPTLSDYVHTAVFASGDFSLVQPDRDDVAGFARFHRLYRAGLSVESRAVRDIPLERSGIMNVDDDRIQRTRERVAALHAELVRNGLVVWTGGNVSERVPGADLFVIKPSGVSYDDLTPQNMVLCTLDGVPVAGAAGSDRSPSSDAAAHAYVYRHMSNVGGVVHTHSPYATSWAARAEPIPCVLTAMADEFGGEIPIGPFALIGDDAIGHGIVETLTGHRSRAVLMQNHGVFTIGRDARDAVKAAVMTEDVARTVHLARTGGPVVPIPPDAVDRLFDRYQNVYGQKPEGALQ